MTTSVQSFPRTLRLRVEGGQFSCAQDGVGGQIGRPVGGSITGLGVHAIGTGATELIHIGQAVLDHDGSAAYFRDAVFNYPTLAEAYKVAALDGLNKI